MYPAGFECEIDRLKAEAIQRKHGINHLGLSPGWWFGPHRKVRGRDHQLMLDGRDMEQEPNGAEELS